MSENVLKGNLNEFKDKIKEKWGELTDNDTASLDGDIDQLADILQQRLGYAKEQAATAAHEFIKGFKDTWKSDDKDCDSNLMKSLGQSAGEYGKAVAEFVEHKPYQSIAIAALSGLVFGLLFRKN